MTQHATLTPVILSGGSGTRLWPLSTDKQPKQFLSLTAADTMFELTLARSIGIENCLPPIIVSNGAHRDLIARQLNSPATIILEPLARNTAPAIALAALAMEDPDGAMLVMPSDHVIENLQAFHAAIARARPLAQAGWLITFGIMPDGPETGYGYIALDEAVADGVQRVAHFVEKPDLGRAQAMLDAGNHVWNAGIFMFTARAYLDALDTLAPEIAWAARDAMAAADHQGAIILPDATAFAKSPSDSIDYAVMEHAEQVACVPVEMGWSDIGSWDSLYVISPKDGEGHVARGEHHAVDSTNCLVVSDGPRVSMSGVHDLIVICADNEVMILPRGHSQSVRALAQMAKAKPRS